MTFPSKSNLIFSQILQPIRIITILSLLSIFRPDDVKWESTVIIFDCFFPIFVGSFIVEWILISPLNRFRETFKLLIYKYLQTLPLEFVGVASFAILSFSSNPDASRVLGIKVSVIVIGLGAVIEILHHYVMPRLRKRQLSDVNGILAVIGMTVALVFLSVYVILTAIHYSHQN
jgi:hypothetical protein